MSAPAFARPSRALVRLVWSITLFLMLIGVGIVVRGMLHIFAPSPVSQSAVNFDAGFAQHPTLTLIHIIPGLFFVLLAPLQFVRKLRTRRPALHRWMGRIAVASGLIIGSTALVMGPLMAIGGANEAAATTLFGILFLFALLKGFVSIRQRKITQHREWMIRAFAIAFAVATIRPIVGIFFATRGLTHLAPHEFFGTAFWLGFTLQLLAAEIWINYTRPKLPAAAASAALSSR